MNYRAGFYLSLAVTLVLIALWQFGPGRDGGSAGRSSAQVAMPSSEALSEISERLARLDEKLDGFGRGLRHLEGRVADVEGNANPLNGFPDEQQVPAYHDSFEPLPSPVESGGPRGLSDTQDAAEQRYATLQNSFDDDPPGDAEQAVEMELEIKQLFNDDRMLGLSVGAVKCKSSQCKIDYENAGEFWDEEIDELELSAALAKHMGGRATLRYGREQGNKKTLYLDLTASAEQSAVGP